MHEEEDCGADGEEEGADVEAFLLFDVKISIQSPTVTPNNPGQYQTEKGLGNRRNEIIRVKNFLVEVIMTVIRGPNLFNRERITNSPQQLATATIRITT